MTFLFWYTLPALVAAALTYALTPLIARLAVALGAIDLPGERKIHTAPTPRLGGLAVVVSIALVLLGSVWLSGGRWRLSPHLAPGLGFGILPVLIVSLVDDIKSVGARKKLLAHTLGAMIAVGFGVSLAPLAHLFGASIPLGFLAAPISVLWIVAVTNAFNIIDGLDGLSAGLALIASTSMAAVFALLGQADMAAIALVLSGALAGFLPYNIHPARLFLGDTGATAIGFCLAAFALKGGSTLTSGFAALLPVFILGLPIADTCIAIVRRTMGRLETRTGGMMVPDSNHIHHRLIALGIDHGRAVLILYGAGLVLAGAALVSIFLTARDAALVVAALLLAGVIGVHRLEYDEFAFLRRGTFLKVYTMPAVKRGMFVVYVDLILAVAAAYLVVGLKTDQWSLAVVRHSVLDLATTFAPVTVLVFWWYGMYRGSWRVSGLHDLTRACSAVAIVTVVGATIVLQVSSTQYSLSLFGIYGLISLVLTASFRASYVILESTKLRLSHQGIPVLIYGAGVSGVAAVRQLFQNGAAGLKPIGFIDDDPRERGKLVGGLPVFGTERELQGIIHMRGAQALLVATDAIPPERLERAAQTCKRAGARMFRLKVRVEQFGETVAFDAPPLKEAVSSVDADRGTETVNPMGVRDAMHVLGSDPCPSCGSHEVRRSKVRSLPERLRKAYSPKRMFRCQRCGWRGRLMPLECPSMPEANWSPDLTAIDTSMGVDQLHKAM
jgi:UDP-GlcNAc:undecaprenyl-phosphate GlcNAc-1-phosphate transferase